MSSKFDFVIVGGGLAGQAAALALGRLGRRTAFVAPRPPKDARTSALMMPVCEFLSKIIAGQESAELGLQRLNEVATPLEAIRIIDATNRLLRSPEMLFSAQDYALEAFSLNIGNASLGDILCDALAEFPNVQRFENLVAHVNSTENGQSVVLDDGCEITAAMLIGADGRNSKVRQAAGIEAKQIKHDQWALVCDLELPRSIGQESIEFHYPQGPFTLVPAGGKIANLVWVDRSDILETHRDVSSAALEKVFEEKSQGLFGRPKLMGKSQVFPLSTLRVSSTAKGNTVLVGEAAHAFPPIGAQGLNLGLRDVESLFDLAQKANFEAENWANDLAVAYGQARSADIWRTTQFVDLLFKSLVSEFLPIQVLRTLGMGSIEHISPVKSQAVRAGLG